MNCTKVTENTFQVSKNLEGILFEGLWDIPNGTSVNAFVVKGEKAAIIDGFWDVDSLDELLESLDKMDIDPKDVEYIIVNHTEPDHSAWIQASKKINPDAKIVCNEKSKDLLEAFFGIDENIMIVEDGDVIDLGDGHKLNVAMIPNVHWPDTMAMFDEKTGTLFPCDAFGSFGNVPEENYDDQLTDEQIEFFEKEAIRYYSNIVASFSMAVKAAIKKCAPLPIKIIAPSHGIVWRENPEKIINDYIRYADYQTGAAEEEVTIIWGSMYGMTESAVNKIKEVLEDEDIKVNIHRVPQSSSGEILTSMWTSTGVILAMPTYEYKMFPPMSAIISELGKKKVQGRVAFRTGSYGWSGGAQRELDSIIDEHKMNWEFIEPVEFKGAPDEEDLEQIERQVKELVKLVKEKARE